MNINLISSKQVFCIISMVLLVSCQQNITPQETISTNSDEKKIRDNRNINKAWINSHCESRLHMWNHAHGKCYTNALRADKDKFDYLKDRFFKSKSESAEVRQKYFDEMNNFMNAISQECSATLPSIEDCMKIK